MSKKTNTMNKIIAIGIAGVMVITSITMVLVLLAGM